MAESTSIVDVLPEDPLILEPQEDKLTKMRKQKETKQVSQYNPEWETKGQYREWICSVEGKPTKASCRFCNTSFPAAPKVLWKHHMSVSHDRSKTWSSVDASKQRPSFMDGETIANKALLAKNAEVLLCGFLLSHNISYNAMDQLAPVLKHCFPDSSIAQEIKLKRTKATNIIKNVIGGCRKDDLIQNLLRTKFSIIINSAMDVWKLQQNCLVVSYNDYSEGRIVSRLWDVLDSPNVVSPDHPNIFETFRLITESFTKHNIPLGNIIGFASDGSSRMMDAINSVATQFQEYLPGVVIYQRLCHILNKVSVEASKQLPEECEALARNIYAVFKRISKKQGPLAQFQAFLSQDKQQELPANYLSEIDVVTNVLDHWTQLQTYFSNQPPADRGPTTDDIYNGLHDGFLVAYYKFLQWVLPMFSSLKTELMESRVAITDVHSKMKLTLRLLLGSYMTKSYIMRSDLANINPRNSDYFLPLHEMYLGVNVMQELQNDYISNYPDHLDHFLRSCQSFLVKACEQLLFEYDFGSPLLQCISMLSPQRVLRGECPSLISLIQHLPRIVGEENLVESIDDEWRRLRFADVPPYISKLRQPDLFWNAIHNWRNLEDVSMFPVLSKFALEALSLPFANADCERVFSSLVSIHFMNQTHKDTINAESLKVLMATECVNSDGCCSSFSPSEKMLRMMTADRLYQEKKPKKPPIEEDSNCIIDGIVTD